MSYSLIFKNCNQSQPQSPDSHKAIGKRAETFPPAKKEKNKKKEGKNDKLTRAGDESPGN